MSIEKKEKYQNVSRLNNFRWNHFLTVLRQLENLDYYVHACAISMLHEHIYQYQVTVGVVQDGQNGRAIKREPSRCIQNIEDALYSSHLG